MSKELRETWSSVLAERRLALGTSEATNVSVYVEFRDRYYQLCDQNKERRAEKLLNRLDIQYENAVSFVEDLDPALQLQEETLASIFWSSLLGIVAAAFRNRVNLEMLFELLEDHDLPQFESNAGSLKDFVENVDIQEPLQNAFVELIECHIVIANHFSPRRSLPIDDFEQIKTRLQEADNRFREHEKQWEERMAIAQVEQEDEIRRRAESMSSASTSVPNGLNGDKMYPSGTHMSYEYVHHLGEGTHGQVAAVRSVNNGELYAMKTIRCINEVHAREKKIEVAREVEAMRSLRHHHIVSVTDWTMDPVHHVFNILVSPVGEGHLGDYLSSNDRNRFNFGKQYDRWFGCLITALHHAHVKLIIHQDIKPSNIIIKQHEPYLADFGTAKDFRLADNSKSSEELIKGTPNYLAPEDQPGVERGRATDVFSLGCVFAEMLTVRQERDIEEFRTWRRKSDSEYPFAFRDNLSKVREWLLDLKCVGNAGFFREQTLSMIQETGAARPVTHSLRRLFRGEDLVCDSCS